MKVNPIEGVYFVSEQRLVCEKPELRNVLRLLSVVTLGFSVFLVNNIPTLRDYVTTESTEEKATHVRLANDEGDLLFVPIESVELFPDIRAPYKERYRSIDVFCQKFVRDPDTGVWRNYVSMIKRSIEQFLESKSDRELSGLLFWSKLKEFRHFIGPNLINIPRLTFFQHFKRVAVTRSVTSISFFGLVSLGLQFYYCVYVLSLYLIIIFIVEIRFAKQREDSVNAYGSWEMVSELARNRAETIEREVVSSELTVGSVVRITDGMSLCADMILVRGDCLVDESALSGESVPVGKSANVPASSRRALLHCGTKVIFGKSEEVWAIAVGVGWNTFKGSLIFELLNKPQKKRKDGAAGIRTVTVCAVATTTALMIKTAIDWREGGVQWSKIVSFLVYLMMSFIPPGVTTFIRVAFLWTKERLAKSGVFLMDSLSIGAAGAVETVCFDKTGTLTSAAVSLKGIVLPGTGKGTARTEPIPIKNEKQYESSVDHTDPSIDLANPTASIERVDHFESMPAWTGKVAESLEEVEETELFLHLSEALALCNSIGVTRTGLVGEPLELELLRASGFELYVDPSTRRTEARVSPRYAELAGVPSDSRFVQIHVNEFSAKRRRMSTVVELQGSSTPRRALLWKGAPEAIRDLVRGGLPPMFDSAAEQHARAGFRVLALGFREVDVACDPATVSETDLTFIGLLLLENKVKPNTKETIDTLKQNLIRPVIVSGDNLFTCIKVATSCGVLRPSSEIRVGIFDAQRRMVEWRRVEAGESGRPDDANSENESVRSDFHLSGHQSTITSSVDELAELPLALDGAAFEHSLKEIGDQREVLRKFMKATTVVGRAQPRQKKLIVLTLKSLAEEKCRTIGFVGDGANDSMALAEADFSLSLNRAQSSLASSYFSDNDEISPIIDIIREGKRTANSEVHLKLIGAIWPIMLLFTIQGVFFESVFSNQFEGAIILAFGIPTWYFFVGLKPYPKLTPYLPASSLASPTMIFRIVGIFSIYPFCFWAFMRIFYSSELYKPEIQVFPPEELTSLDFPHNNVKVIFIMTQIVTSVVSLGCLQTFPFSENLWSSKGLKLYVSFYFAIVAIPLVLVPFDSIPFVSKFLFLINVSRMSLSQYFFIYLFPTITGICIYFAIRIPHTISLILQTKRMKSKKKSLASETRKLEKVKF